MNLFQVALHWKGGVCFSANVGRREAAEDMGGGHQRACMFEYLQALVLVDMSENTVLIPLCSPVFVTALLLAIVVLPCKIIALQASSSPVLS